MANPKLAMIPTGYKAGKVYSVLPESGVGDFTFDRDSKATRVNENGLIEVMDNDVPRLDYTDGGCPSLLLEPESTNLISYSEDISNSYWQKLGSSTTNGFTSPSGVGNAYKLVEDTSNGLHWMYSGAITVTDATTYSVSVFAKKGERNSIRISQKDGIAVIVNLESKEFDSIGVGVINSNITELINDWVRIDYSFQTTSTSEEIYIYVADNGAINYQGNGTSGIYIWGAMLEELPYPTSYIPTNGSAVTRVGEICSGAGDASTFNDSEGVLMAEISALADDTTARRVSLSNGSVSNMIEIGYTNIDNQIKGRLTSEGSTSANINFIESNITFLNKISFSYKENDFALWVNGFEVGTNTNGNTPIGLNNLSFQRGGGSSDFYGNTKQIQYFDSTLTDAELETLTSWQSFSEMANAQNYTII